MAQIPRHWKCAAGAICCIVASQRVVEVPMLASAKWALNAAGPKSCSEQPAFDQCDHPWAATEAWWYAVGNIMACASHMHLRPEATVCNLTEKRAIKSAKALLKFSNDPTQETFVEAARKAKRFRERLLEGQSIRQLPLAQSGGLGLGVPFPVTTVLLPAERSAATLQLRGGLAMPLLALAVTGRSRPSITNIIEALRAGVRHLEVPPGIANAVGQAIQASGVARKEVFLSVRWELPLDSEVRFEELLAALRTSYVELVLMPRSPDAGSNWQRLENLKSKGKVLAMGIVDFPAERLDEFPRIGVTAEYAQCAFSPYRHGNTRSTWKLFGSRSIALAGSALLSDWPHALRPTDDPHIQAIARRVRRTTAQVLIRWALQLGLAVVFRSSNQKHIVENLDVFDFGLPDEEMQLISSLTTLQEPWRQPGDGFAHVYTAWPQAPASANRQSSSASGEL